MIVGIKFLRQALFPLVASLYLLPLNAYIHAYLPTYLPACLPACLPTYLPTYLSAHARHSKNPSRFPIE